MQAAQLFTRGLSNSEPFACLVLNPQGLTAQEDVAIREDWVEAHPR
jgi:hypothetical protein